MQPEGATCFLAHAPPALRIGIKGAAARATLARRGFAAPDTPNSWLPCSFATRDDGRLLRLGFGEFLLERDLPATGTADWHGLRIETQQPCHLLARTDHCYLLQGPGCGAVFAEVCSADLHALAQAPRAVVLTLMAGVAVCVLRDADTGASPGSYRIWCDPSYGHYLSSVLAAVVTSNGGLVQGGLQSSNEVFA